MKTWFITGVSSGLGLALAKAVIASGDKVAGTLRTEEQRVTFSQMAQGQSFGFVLDVCSEVDIPRVVSQVEEEVGPIDVLVNNAGYGYEGAIEEALSADIRAQFDVNVFGAISVIGVRYHRAGAKYECHKQSCCHDRVHRLDGWP